MNFSRALFSQFFSQALVVPVFETVQVSLHLSVVEALLFFAVLALKPLVNFSDGLVLLWNLASRVRALNVFEGVTVDEQFDTLLFLAGVMLTS